jgi:hypothetical protein
MAKDSSKLAVQQFKGIRYCYFQHGARQRQSESSTPYKHILRL